MGCPLAMYIKEWRRGERAGPYGAPRKSPTHTGSRIPPFQVVGFPFPFPEWERGKEVEREKEKGGRATTPC